MENWKKGCFIYLAAILVVIGIPFLFMCIVDPYNVTLLVTTQHLNAKLPALSNQSRLEKAAAIIRYKPDTIIVGSSVADGAFMLPGETLNYDNERVAHIRDYAKEPFIYDAGVRAGVIEDGYEMMKHAYANNPHLKKVIAWYEWGQFTDLRAIKDVHDTDLYGQTHIFPIGYKKYITWMGFTDAVHTIETNNGLPDDAIYDGFKNPRKLIKQLLTNDAHADDDDGFSTIKRDTLSEYVVTAKGSQILSHQLYFAHWFTQHLNRLQHNVGDEALHEQDALEVLRKMVTFAKEKNIEFTLYLSPHPPLVWSMARKAGVWPQYEQWLKAVAEITPFYDYSRLPQLIRDDNYKYFWYDTLHFKAILGDEMLPTILHNNENNHSDYYITKDTLAANLAARKQELDAWQASHPYEMDIINTLDYDPARENDLNMIVPQPYLPIYHGFRVIRQFETQYIAVPANQEPYDLQRIIHGDYHPMFTGKSVGEVVQHIRQFEADHNK